MTWQPKSENTSKESENSSTQDLLSNTTSPEQTNFPWINKDQHLIVSSEPEYKYNEALYISEIMEYIDKTYGEHYSRNKFQATEFIIDSGHGTGFCIGNVLKYAQRYGRKGSPEDWRKDLMKVIHYAVIQLHVHDVTYEDDK